VPPGEIAPTATTCSDYLASPTGNQLNTLLYGVKSGAINNVAPGVFFYYSSLTVPAGNSTILIHQTITTGQGSNYLFAIQQGQAVLYSSTCGNTIPNVSNVSITTDGDATITLTASAPTTVIVGVKYSASSVAGQPVPSPTTVHYNFATILNSVTVNSNANGLDLAPK
jgi:hypothetical protein